VANGNKQIVYETKNGPYQGIEKDKAFIKDHRIEK